MPLVIDATPGGPNANSYLTLAEAQEYFSRRLPIAEWEDADSQEVLLVMATRVLNALAQPFKVFVAGSNGVGHYRIRRQWTGAPATTTQRLAWPRTGMFDMNGNAIPPNVIPQDLKDATAELAGQLAKEDRTLDNDVVTQGITSVRAGSVSVSFKDGIVPQVIPDAVYNMMPVSWLTAEGYEPAMQAQFDVVSD